MNVKTYCGTKEQILEQLRKDLDFKPMEDRYKEGVSYPFNSDGLSGQTLKEQLDEGQTNVFWFEFVKDPNGEVFGSMNHAKTRILKG